MIIYIFLYLNKINLSFAFLALFNHFIQIILIIKNKLENKNQ